MTEIQEITPIERDELVGATAELFAEGYRFVHVCCTTLESSYELTYSFDKDYRLKNLRITVTPGEEVPSISVIYPNAFLYENEIHDLFGLEIRNIAVNYHGTLYRTKVKTPFSVGNVKVPVPPQPKAEAPREKPEGVKEQAAVPEEKSTG
ncbi:MAG TPA: NADH-quinone oxidoreductase subunit C [Geobacteraceae bacterium]|nr:NADH-quinone oxidoreductase subunit C [Geobacteraceae bacterium]